MGAIGWVGMAALSAFVAVTPGEAAGRLCAGIAGAGLITRLNCPEPVCPLESVTATVNEE